MGVLTAAKRNRLRSNQFALPGSRRFPVHTRRHAANAKARATQQYNRGNISRSTRDKIHAKANRVLRRKKR